MEWPESFTFVGLFACVAFVIFSLSQCQINANNKEAETVQNFVNEGYIQETGRDGKIWIKKEK